MVYGVIAWDTYVGSSYIKNLRGERAVRAAFKEALDNAVAEAKRHFAMEYKDSRGA